jgi:hypothetical protein
MIAPSPSRLWVGVFERLNESSTQAVMDFYLGEGFAEDVVEDSIAFSHLGLARGSRPGGQALYYNDHPDAIMESADARAAGLAGTDARKALPV